jgi:hypothetical protein
VDTHILIIGCIQISVEQKTWFDAEILRHAHFLFKSRVLWVIRQIATIYGDHLGYKVHILSGREMHREIYRKLQRIASSV